MILIGLNFFNKRFTLSFRFFSFHPHQLLFLFSLVFLVDYLFSFFFSFTSLLVSLCNINILWLSFTRCTTINANFDCVLRHATLEEWVMGLVRGLHTMIVIEGATNNGVIIWFKSRLRISYHQLDFFEIALRMAERRLVWLCSTVPTPLTEKRKITKKTHTNNSQACRHKQSTFGLLATHEKK